jgi:RNA polymerase sigma-32 factor
MAGTANLSASGYDVGLQRYLAEARRFPMLEEAEEHLLAKRWREQGDRVARQRLVASHLRLVAKLASGYRGYGLPLADLISEGNMGLLRATDGFEPERGFRFATYATWWIRAAIHEYVLRSRSLVKMGTTANQKRLFFKLAKLKSEISVVEDGDMRPDQVEVIANGLGVKQQDVVDMNRRLSGDVSLSASIRAEDDSETWQDRVADAAPNAEAVLGDGEEAARRREALVESLTVLDERERRIIEARRLAEEPVRLKQLADDFGLSRERVRQIEARAFQKLRSAVKRRLAASSGPAMMPAY